MMSNENINPVLSKPRPFSVMNQQVAYRLAMEGFEIINVVPSNKYASEARFVFVFNGTPVFKKRFFAVREEVERDADRLVSEKDNAAKEIERLKAENAALKAEICRQNCEKTAESTQKSAENIQETAENPQKISENLQEISENIKILLENSDAEKIMDKLAELQAIGNCILTNIAATNFYTNFHRKTENKGGRNKI